MSKSRLSLMNNNWIIVVFRFAHLITPIHSKNIWIIFHILCFIVDTYDLIWAKSKKSNRTRLSRWISVHGVAASQNHALHDVRANALLFLLSYTNLDINIDDEIKNSQIHHFHFYCYANSQQVLQCSLDKNQFNCRLFSFSNMRIISIVADH